MGKGVAAPGAAAGAGPNNPPSGMGIEVGPAGADGPLTGAMGLAVRLALASSVSEIEVAKNATPNHTVARVKALAALRPCIMPLKPPGPCPCPNAPPSDGCSKTMPTSARAISK